MSVSTEPVDPLVGQSVNGYVVEGRLGEGGMGLVYACLQPDIGKRAALKVLKPEVSGDPEIVSRLVAEARAVNAIRHRGIVDIFGYARLPDGRQGIIMEFLEGRSLEDELVAEQTAHRSMPVKRVLQVMDEVLNALAAAHKAGVIHRDLKPSNIFLCRGPSGDEHVKLLDFGIARMGVVNQTKASVVLGTPSYMAPEQARGESVGPALDLYAVGVILFEMLTGRLPYVADNAVRVIYMHLEAPIPRPSSINPALPGAIDDIVMKLLAKRTHERFESAEGLRRELLRLKVALSDPSAMTTIEEPIAPFDSAQPIERTFIRAATPQRPTDLDRTGVLSAPAAPPPAETRPAAGTGGGTSASSPAPPEGPRPDARSAGESVRAQPAGPDTARVTSGGVATLGLAAPAARPPDAEAPAAPVAGGDEVSLPPALARPSGQGRMLVGAAVIVVALVGAVVALGRGPAPDPGAPRGAVERPAPEVAQPAPPEPPKPTEPPPAPAPALAAVPTEVLPAPAAPTPAPVGAAVPGEAAPGRAKRPDGKPQRSLARQLERVSARVKEARAQGLDTDVIERQLAVVRSRLATATSEEERGQLEAILERIAEDVEGR